MRKFIQQKLKEQKGLTLIELLAVIVILAIIAAIAVPAIGNLIENSRYSAVKADALNAINAANIYLTENPEDTNGVTVNELKTAGYLDTIGELVGTEVITDTTDGLQIDSATVITYSGAKTVTFTDATIKDINGDTAKGSDAGNREVKTP